VSISATKGGKTGKSDIPIDASGELYSHVFGTTATPFERLVVDRKIMGPCWLNVTAPKVNKGEAVSLGNDAVSLLYEAHLFTTLRRSRGPNSKLKPISRTYLLSLQAMLRHRKTFLV
jgi:hypothetical protein